MVAFWPGMLGAGLTPRWAVLWVGLPILAVPPRMTAIGWVGASFLAFAVLSLAWSPFPFDGVYELAVFGAGALAFCLGSNLERLGHVFYGAALGLLPSSTIAVIQWFHGPIADILQLTPHPSGLFVNANMMAEASALVVCGLIATHRHFTLCRYAAVFASLPVLPPMRHSQIADHAAERQKSAFRVLAAKPIFTASSSVISAVAVAASLPALIFPMQRASMIALAIVGMISIALIAIKRHAWKWHGASVGPMITLCATGLCTILFIALSKPTGSLSERFDIWRATLSGLTPFGHGSGSFEGLFPIYSNDLLNGLYLRPLYAHNDLLHLAFEYGMFSLIPAAMAALLLARSVSPLRCVLAVFVIVGLFGFPLFMPATLFLASIVAGHLSREWPELRWAELYRGILRYRRLGHA
jgi:hypothetical protein